MSSGRLGHLMARKAQLDSEVDREISALSPDHVRLTHLKRRKLQLKDEIARLAGS